LKVSEPVSTGHALISHLPLIGAAIDDGGTAQDIMDRVAALLHEKIDHYDWVGFYLMDNDELVLGPFRGEPSPHTRIPLGNGICGAAATEKQTIIVADVNADPRFLACSLTTRSEIVVPIMDGSVCLGEIDIDSDQPDAFGESDQELLEAVAARMAPILRSV
jgi:putative methionine-R-sulfoxide reductase with GAF domain